MKQVSKSVPFEDIITDEQARRIGATETSLLALKESIRTLGLLDPLIVEEVSGGKYRLRAGRSRYLCIKSLREEESANFETVNCTVLEFEPHELVDEIYKNYKTAQVIFDSNDKRAALTKLEQARHYREQMQQFPHLFPNFAEVAKFNNKDIAEVKESLDLLAIDPIVMLKIEELNLQRPGTIPAMCIQEIARFAADLKRPLPPEGQMEVVEELISPNLSDKRVLVLRDKMEALVRRVRSKYVHETRGRKPASTITPPLDLIEDVDFDFVEATAEENTIASQDTKAEPVDIADMNILPTQHPSISEGSKRVAHTLEVDPLSSATEAEPLDLAEDMIGAVLPESLVSDDKATVAAPMRPATGGLGLTLIEASMTNIERALGKGDLLLTAEQFERLDARWRAIRTLLEQSVLQHA